MKKNKVHPDYFKLPFGELVLKYGYAWLKEQGRIFDENAKELEEV